ncbi:S8 family serine peptidase [Vibrio sp. SCSIO 43137]|uniref:S8 family serine peptidase n=1 Tax=Vibrio sp. SCSIO 43137 TaxID=3021011 RepID=UPI0023075236|nr:S8 family serine peptidase [Vibrio sp. SCSIO 43137]WCE31514.1 S8 family serine peptidase [Vibrio sp. SCSIO 43137]
MIRINQLKLLLIALLFFISSAFAKPLPNQALIDKAIEKGTVRVIVQFDVAFTAEGELPDAAAVGLQRAAIASAQGQLMSGLRSNSSVIARFQTIPSMVLSLDADELQQLYNRDDIVNVIEDTPIPLVMAESNNIIGSVNAWNDGYSGAGQTVVILDTGVDKYHPFFSSGVSNKVVAEACFSTNRLGYSSSVCPGGVESSTSAGSGIDCTSAASGYPNAQGDCAHGTHVAGSAAGNDGSGADFGVARDANIIAIQIFSLFPDYCNNSDCMLTWQSDQMAALEHVHLTLQHSFNIASVNMSIGGGSYSATCDDDPLKNIIDNLRSDDIATVIAAGNSGSRTAISGPACISTSVSIGATEDDDDVASFSNVASFMDLFAPGHTITSAVPGGGTSTWGGTSMATPHVAGAWAVLKQSKPAATVDEVLQALKNTGTPINDQRTGGSVNGIPRINVDLALNNLVNTEPDITPPTITAPADVSAEATASATPVNLDSPVVSDDIDPNPAVENNAPAGFPVGETIVVWTATDASGNSADDSQTVTVTDTTGPVISLLGNNPTEVILDNSYSDAGATAIDLVDGDVSSSIVSDSNVDTSVLGSYSVTYNVSDSRSNPATPVVRTVNVVEAPVALSITGLSPSAAQLGVDTFVVVNGSGFNAGTSVSFVNGSGKTPQYNISSRSATRLEGTLTSQTNGPNRDRVWDVVVSNSDGSNDTLSGGLLLTIGAPPVNQPLVANAGPDQTVLDADDNGSENVTLNGSGSSDPEGSSLTYNWSWSGGGSASGVTPSASFPVGTTTVTLTVSDGELSSMDTVDITVNAPSSGITIDDITGYKVKGQQKADLTWSGATSDNVIIHRNSTSFTTANDGFVTDNINRKGGGTYIYKVCEEDAPTNCSDEVTLNF